MFLTAALWSGISCARAIMVHAAWDQAGQVVSQSDAASLDSVRNVISDTAYGKQVETAVVVPKTASSDPLTIKRQPADCGGQLGDLVSFKVAAEGDDLDFVWEYSDDDGETWQSYDAVEPDFCVYVDEDTDGRLVRCVITDAYGNTVASDPARMILRYELFIVSQPENVTVYEGSELYVILTESNRNGIYRCVAVDFQGQSTVSEAATVVITDEDED